MEANALKDRKGFTLLEVLIAITLLALMVLALYHSAATIMIRNVENSIADEAVKIANEKIEDLRNTKFSTLSPGNSTETITRHIRNFDQPFTVITGINIYDTAAKVTVDVNWQYKGGNHTYRIETVIADNE